MGEQRAVEVCVCMIAGIREEVGTIVRARPFVARGSGTEEGGGDVLEGSVRAKYSSCEVTAQILHHPSAVSVLHAKLVRSAPALPVRPGFGVLEAHQGAVFDIPDVVNGLFSKQNPININQVSLHAPGRTISASLYLYLINCVRDEFRCGGSFGV